MIGEILITEGPEKGERFEICEPSVVNLADGKLQFGPLVDPAQDCAFRFQLDGEELIVESGGDGDLQFNQRPIEGPQRVAHGDMITLSGVSFVFYMTRSMTRRKKAKDTTRKHHVLSRMALKDVSSVVEDLHAHRTHLGAFYRIVSEIHLGLGVDHLMGGMLDVLLEELPSAQRAFIFRLLDDGLLSRVSTRMRKGVNPSTRASRSLLDEVVRGRDAILSRNMLKDSRFKRRESIVIEQINTAICAPFFKGDKVAGAILVDSNKPGDPFDSVDLELVTAVAGQLSLALERQQMHLLEAVKKELEAEKSDIERALAEAQSVQQFLLPQALPKVLGCELAVRSDFCEKLGGDYYDLFPLDSYRMALVVADVSGHSISSALVMAMTRSIVRCYCQQYQTPSEVLAATNRAVRNDTQVGMFVTLFLGFLNTREMTLSFANAGHHYPILIEADSRKLRELDSGGFPLGLRAGATYPADKLYLKGGDLLVLYTDGVVEAKDPTGKMFGKQGVLKPLEKLETLTASVVADKIFDAVGIHLAGHPALDDISILTLSVDPAYDSLYFDVISTEEKAEEAARIIAAYARDHGFLPERREAHFRLVLREASANAITHGNRGNPGKRLSYYVRSDSAVMRVSISDEGKGFQGNVRLKQVEIDTKTLRGRGLFLIRKYADRMCYNEQGNELILDFHKDGFGNPDQTETAGS